MGFAITMMALITTFTISYGCYSSTEIGGKFYCGQLICPEETVNCRVVSKNDPKDSKIIITNEVCSDSNGNTLLENTFNTDNPSGATVDSESSVGPLYSERAREHIAAAHQTINENIAAAHQTINENIQRIHNDLRNIPFFGGASPTQFSGNTPSQNEE